MKLLLEQLSLEYKIQETMTIQEFDYITGTDKLTLVQFHAEWCGPCKAMMPIVEDVQNIFGDKLQVIQIDVDQASEIAQEFFISSVPTFITMTQNDILWRHSGVIPKLALVQEIDNTLKDMNK